MAQTILAEHTWHPRGFTPETALAPRICTAIGDDAATDANGYKHIFHVLTAAPLSGLAPGANIVTAGPDLVVAGDVTGLWAAGAALDVAITVEGGTNINASIANNTGTTIGPDDMAAIVAAALNTLGAGEIQCGATANQVTISALVGVTALTITLWAVAP